MSDRTLRVDASMNLTVNVREAPGQAFSAKIQEHFSNSGTDTAEASVEDKYASTIKIAPGVTETINVADIAPTKLDHLFIKTDGAITVQLGPTAGDAKPVDSMFYSDGGLPVGTTEFKLKNPSTADTVNVTVVATGH